MRSVIVRDVTFEVYFVCCTVVILIQNAAVIRKRKGRGFFEVSCNTLFHLVEHIGWGGGGECPGLELFVMIDRNRGRIM